MVAPQNGDAAGGVGADGIRPQFTIRSQLIDELGVGGKKDIVRSAILDLLGKYGAGGIDEADVEAGLGFLERGLNGGEIRGSGDGENQKAT